MEVPEFQNFMLPILRIFEDKKEHNIKECKDTVIKYFNLTETDIKKLVPSWKQGIFITTSDFTNEAKDYIKKVAQNIILINGTLLTKLMIENNVGVQTNYTYEQVKYIEEVRVWLKELLTKQ